MEDNKEKDNKVSLGYLRRVTSNYELTLQEAQEIIGDEYEVVEI